VQQRWHKRGRNPNDDNRHRNDDIALPQAVQTIVAAAGQEVGALLSSKLWEVNPTSHIAVPRSLSMQYMTVTVPASESAARKGHAK
jgi:hypothetical protein